MRNSILKLSRLTSLLFCRMFGHRWRYKDYSNYMKTDGEMYDFRASKSCKRCSRQAYFYDNWRTETKSNLDFESDYYERKTININNVKYT